MVDITIYCSVNHSVVTWCILILYLISVYFNAFLYVVITQYVLGYY